MKVFRKTQALVLCVVLVCLCLAAVFSCLGYVQTASAAEKQLDEKANYYGTKLTDPVSVAFYNILNNMDFASGESVSITDQSILNEAAAYTVGDPTVMKKLGAAIDSFRYDRTEFFYVDFDMLTLNVKTRGNTLIAELGAGRSDSYFVEGFNKNNVAAEISWYNAELKKFVDGIDLPQDATAEQKAKAVTKAVAEKITYSFCVDENGNDTEGAPFIRTAYGALKYGKGVCEGYSRLFKAAMDSLGETNVLINGWLSADEEVGAHMWNLVKSGDKWYGADPTVADEDKLTYDARGLDWAQGELLGIDHFEDAIVSTSNYNMPFPKIYREGIKEEGGAPMEQEVKGLKVEVSEDKKVATISYNGKDAEALKADELYMVIRVAIITDGVSNPDVKWEPISNYEIYGWVHTVDGKTTFDLSGANSGHVEYLQFGICNADADNKTSLGFGQYSDKHFENSVVANTEKAFVNENVDPTYRAELRGTPDLALITLDTTDGEQPKTITVQYSRDLAFDNDTDSEPIVTFKAIRTADGTEVDVGDWASITNVKLVDEKHISFVFRPATKNCILICGSFLLS